MIERHEAGTASLAERIDATRRCQQHGYRVRIRIDPGILYPNWKAGYAAMIQETLTAIEPENITLGMLRLLPGHRRLATSTYGNRAKELCSQSFVRGASDGKLRYPPKERADFYAFLIETIRSFDKNVSISLCRETPEIWNILKDCCTLGKCNCVIW
jgi:DNA repair photolyase